MVVRVAQFLAIFLPLSGAIWMFAREEGPRFMIILHAWQTLLTGLLAIVAAGVGGYFVHRQTTTTERLERERVVRRFESEKAVLPHTLSAVLAYAREAVEFLKDVQALVPPGNRTLPKGVALAKRPPIAPKEAIEQIVRLIQASHDSDLRTYLSALLKEIQIHSARLWGMNDALGASSRLTQSIGDVENHMMLTGEICGRCGVLFKLAREDDPVILGPLTAQQVTNGLWNVGVDDIDFPDVYRRVGKKYP